MSEIIKQKTAKPRSTVKVQRGRTGSDLPPAIQGSSQGLTGKSREEVARDPGRPPRIPMHQSQSCNFPKHLMEEGFYYRDALDKPGRINKLLQAGYDFALDDQGNKFSYPAGSLFMYTMKLPIDYRNEDLKQKSEAAAEVRRTQDKKASALGEGEYIPDGRKSVLTTD